MKPSLLDAESRRAAIFLDQLSGSGHGAVANGSFPPESYLHDLGQIEVLSTLIRQVYEQTMQARTGLTLIEWRALEAIGYAPGITASELATYWEYDKVAVSRALQNLKRRELVVSSQHQGDKRKTELRHTDAGRIAFQDHLEIKRRYLDALSGVLSKDELSTYNSITRKLVDHFRRVKQVANKR